MKRQKNLRNLRKNLKRKIKNNFNSLNYDSKRSKLF